MVAGAAQLRRGGKLAARAAVQGRLAPRRGDGRLACKLLPALPTAYLLLSRATISWAAVWELRGVRGPGGRQGNRGVP